MTSELGPGASETFSDDEHITFDRLAVFRDMEEALEGLVRKYLISPDDLKNLLEVVMALSETMDQSSKELDELNKQRGEIENMWLAEKNKWRLAEKSKLELECQYDIERAQFVSEKRSLEGKKADLEARLAQTKQQKQEIESELLQLKDKIAHDEHTRRKLTQHYRNQFENIRTASIKRATSRKRQRWKYAKPSQQDQLLPVPGPHPEVNEPVVTEAISEDNVALPVPSTLDVGSIGWQDGTDEQNGYVFAQSAPENLEGITLYDELMSAMDPVALGGSKADLQMLLKEKEQWDNDRSELVSEGQRFREEKEALESENTRLRIEIDNLQQTEKALHAKLLEVRKEADIVLSTYFNQPYKDFCITQVELLNVLKMHQNAQIQLESEREEKRRLQQQLENKKTWFDRFRSKIKTALSKDRSIPDEENGNEIERPNELPARQDTPSLPGRPNMALPNTAQGQLTSCAHTTTVKDWLLTKSSFVPNDSLPAWVGHIPLSGIDIRSIDCTTVGRVRKTFSKDSSPHSSLKKNASAQTLTPGCEVTNEGSECHWKAEVWIATSDEFSAFIEIVDLLGKAKKVRQRFLVKPSTQRVQCMRAIPGYVEPSQDYLNYQSLDLSWVEDMYSSKSQPRPSTAIDSEARFSKSEEFSPEGTEVHDHNLLESVTAGTPPKSKNTTRRMCLKKKTFVRKKPTDSMWLITADGRLCFYPTSDPSHVLINSIQLCQRAFCLLYAQSKVFVGHTGALMTIYSKLTGTWILDSPKKINLSSSSLSTTTGSSDDVRCMVEVGHQLWVACGGSINFFDATTLEVKGFTTVPEGILNNIVVSGSVAIATVQNGSTLYIYDTESTNLLSTFSLTSLASMIGIPPDKLQISGIIADEVTMYVCTSNGKMATIPTASVLSLKHSDTVADQCATSAHSHLGAAACLLHVPLPSSCYQPQLGQGRNKTGSDHDFMIMSAGMGHCSQQLCDEGYCVMAWSCPTRASI